MRQPTIFETRPLSELVALPASVLRESIADMRELVDASRCAAWSPDTDPRLRRVLRIEADGLDAHILKLQSALRAQRKAKAS